MEKKEIFKHIIRAVEKSQVGDREKEIVNSVYLVVCGESTRSTRAARRRIILYGDYFGKNIIFFLELISQSGMVVSEEDADGKSMLIEGVFIQIKKAVADTRGSGRDVVDLAYSATTRNSTASTRSARRMKILSGDYFGANLHFFLELLDQCGLEVVEKTN